MNPFRFHLVSLNEIIFPGKINQVNKKDLMLFSSEGLKLNEKIFSWILSPDHTKENEVSLELFPMKTVITFLSLFG